MKRKFILVSLIVVALVISLSVTGYWLLLRPDARAIASVKKVREELRQQGYKADLADFDFSVSPEVLNREMAITNSFNARGIGANADSPNLMPVIGSNTVVAVVREPALILDYARGPNGADELGWEELREQLRDGSGKVDAALAAVNSGPIAFNLNSRGGFAMLLPHLATLKHLSQVFGARAVLNLHDGQREAAWTNLLAETRLATAWNPEPAQVSQMVRFALAGLAYNTTWQLLQSPGWSDAQLQRLQSEWETVDYLTGLPDTMAFKRASAAASCEWERNPQKADRFSWGEFWREIFHHPTYAWDNLRSEYRHEQYLNQGSYSDETNALIFFREREDEYRAAVRATNWLQMRSMPGVTNRAFFLSKQHSRLQSMLNLQELSLAVQGRSVGFLGRATEAEARRRVLITAIALERYHAKYDSYPPTLGSLTPEFLAKPLPDFINGEPLCYRLTERGKFLLYSVGLDGVDNGGILANAEQRRRQFVDHSLIGSVPDADIVWPLPATAQEVQSRREQEERALATQEREQIKNDADHDWKQSLDRQSRTASILNTKWEPDSGDMKFKGRLLADYLSGKSAGDTNKITLAELLSPRQIITGAEPEDLTFEVPVRFDAITNVGNLVIMVDADPDEPLTSDTGAKQQEIIAAPNGNCRLVWHAIFDPPGRHALQILLSAATEQGGEFAGKGPAIAVTTSNLCQFSLDSATYDVFAGATFHARLPESNCVYSIECVTTNGQHLKTLSGATTNGEFNAVWNLIGDEGTQMHGETFNSVVHIQFPDSGRSQTLRGP